MKKVIAIVILCGCALVFGYSVEAHESGQYHFTGTLNGKYPIFMTLALNDLNVDGYYYYYSIGTLIDLEGTFMNDGSFVINEFVDGECTGTFKGTFFNGYTTASGSWTDAPGKKNLPFSLELVAGEVVFESHRYEVTAYAPQFTGDAHGMQELITDTILALFESFIEDYRLDMEDEPEWGWEFVCDYTIEFYSEYFISILLEVYEHTGGAHGNAYYVCLNHLEEKGSAEFLDLEDFFLGNTDYGAILSEILIHELKEQDAAWILDGSIQNIEPDLLVFNVTPKGLLCTFAPYAVGPYAEGPHQVTIPFKKLRSIIDTRGPLGTFIK